MVLSRSLGSVQSRTHRVLSTFRVERLTPLLTNPSWKLPHRRAQRFVSSVSVDPAKLTVFIVTVACMLACLLHSFLLPPPPSLHSYYTRASSPELQLSNVYFTLREPASSHCGWHLLYLFLPQGSRVFLFPQLLIDL